MIKKLGSLFDTEHFNIGHGVNCKGLMGAGIAKAFSMRLEANLATYRAACAKTLTPGEVVVRVDTDKTTGTKYRVFNMATQENPGADATYHALFTSAMASFKYMKSINESSNESTHGYVLAIPMIGCGIGGLEWTETSAVLRTVELLNPGYEFEVWKLP